MRLLHLNEHIYQEGDQVPTGHWREIIANGNRIEQQFEERLEEIRLEIEETERPISRLNCVFTFASQEMEGYLRSGRDGKLYHFEVDETDYSIHNHQIITHFSHLFPRGDFDLLLRDEHLLRLYWQGTPDDVYRSNLTGEVIDYVPEYLVGVSPTIIKVT